MSLQKLLTIKEDSFYHGDPLEGSIVWPKAREGFWVAVLRDGQFEAEISSSSVDLIALEGKRVKISVDGKGKGHFIRRGFNFRQRAQISLGENVTITTNRKTSIMSLQKIQTALKAPKGQTNKFGGYKYRNCEDILEAVKPLLAEHGYHLTLSDEILAVGDPVASYTASETVPVTSKTISGRVYVKATATLFNGIVAIASTTAYAREEDSKKGCDAAQLTGACSSYARKYALNGLFCIDDTRDADSQQ